MFWKIYTGVVTFAAVCMYAHIRYVEGWVAGMGVAVDAQLKAETKTEEINSEN